MMQRIIALSIVLFSVFWFIVGLIIIVSTLMYRDMTFLDRFSGVSIGVCMMLGSVIFFIRK